MNVETPSTGRVWSQQQNDIFEQFQSGRRHFVVRARAGTGKTTTILEGLKSAPEQRILFAAFNKRIVEEVTPKNQNPNVEVKTLHGVGFACVRRYRERVQVARGNDREDKIVEEVCGTQAPDVIKRSGRKADDEGARDGAAGHGRPVSCSTWRKSSNASRTNSGSRWDSTYRLRRGARARVHERRGAAEDRRRDRLRGHALPAGPQWLAA
jgi:hypothetical protein